MKHSPEGTRVCKGSSSYSPDVVVSTVSVIYLQVASQVVNQLIRFFIWVQFSTCALCFSAVLIGGVKQFNML